MREQAPGPRPRGRVRDLSRPSSPRRPWGAKQGLLVTALVWVQMAGVASGNWTSSPSPPSMTISTATLAAPTGPTASNGACVVLIQADVNLSWTATSSTFADGYEIFRSLTSGGPYTSIATVSGHTTTNYTDSTVAFSQAYHYVVQAKKNNWRSANSAQVSVTTPSSLCL